jgi:hypothetical protein
MHATFLPSANGKTEYYSQSGNKLKHESIYYPGISMKDKKKTKQKLPPVNIEKTLYELDSLTKLNEFRFKVDSTLVSKIKKCHPEFNDSDINPFFVSADSILLKVQDVKIDISNYISGQIDGAFYTIEADIKYKNRKEYRHEFNIGGGSPQNTQIRTWLILYTLFLNNDLFETISTEQCFSEDKFINVFCRFIEWKKYPNPDNPLIPKPEGFPKSVKEI